MKKILCICLMLMGLLMGFAAAEEMTGTWGFAGGAEVHGDGFVLYADGTGEWLEAMNYDLFPLREFLYTGDTFVWRVESEGDRQYLIENYPDGRTRKWEIQRFDDSGEIHIPEGDGGGFYWPVKAEDVVIAENPFDVISVLQAKDGSFAKNKKYEVYQGPGEEYGRSGGGKGVVSTNGSIDCYGTWNDWLLIEYAISAEKHRYGWIALDQLRETDEYDTLEFIKNEYGEYNYGVLIQDAALTDDPFYSKNVTAYTPAGASVHVLAKKWDYLLVEGFIGRQRCMGFVHESYVDMKYGYAENVDCFIDEAGSYSQADIHAAMEAVKEAVRKWFSGTSVVSIKYIEAESADADDWWQPEEENREGMQLYADLNGMSFYDYEIASYAVAKDYGFILYRDIGGEWEVCNWGYE